MSDPLSALFLPLSEEIIPLAAPSDGFFLGAEADYRLPAGMLCVQPFKPDHDALLAQGHMVVRALTSEGFGLGLCLLGKHKRENLARLGQAWLALRPGGVLLASASNDTGAASLMKAFAAGIAPVQSLAKHHSKVFWASKTDDPAAARQAEDWVREGAMQYVEAIAAWSQPGIYNWDSVDKGSALLASHLPDDLRGRVADVGAGWGYLSRQVLARKGAVTALDLFEADERALQAALRKLEGSTLPITGHWHDIRQGLPRRAFQTVVMNPPFHVGKAVDIELGRACVVAAAEAVAPGGRLLLVANRHLPYEPVLEATLGRFRVLGEDKAYKVIESRRSRG